MAEAALRPRLALPASLREQLDVLAAGAAEHALRVSSAHETGRSVQYPPPTVLASLEASLRQFEATAQASVRDVESLGANPAGTPANLNSYGVRAEWFRIGQQLSMAKECFRACSSTNVPAHTCDTAERVFVVEGCLGLVLAVANTLELIDRANADAIVVAAGEVDVCATVLRRAAPGSYAAIISATRDLSESIHRVVFAVESRISAGSDDDGAPELRIPIDTLSKALPLLISSTRVGILHPEQDGVRLSAEYAFEQIASATSALRSALRQRLLLPSGDASGHSEFTAAAKECLAAGNAGTPPDVGRRALRRFEDACMVLADRRVLEAPRDNAVLTEIAACGAETAATMPAAACRRVCDAIGRAVSARVVAAAADVRQRVAGAKTTEMAVATAAAGADDTALNVGEDVTALLGQLALLEDVAAVLQPGAASGKVAAALRAQATALMNADLPRVMVVSGLVFWLELIEHHAASLVP